MDVCLLWVLCVVRQRSLRRADQSSRGVLPTVVRRCVWSRNIMIEEAMARWGLSRQKKVRILISVPWYWMFCFFPHFRALKKPKKWIDKLLLFCGIKMQNILTFKTKYDVCVPLNGSRFLYSGHKHNGSVLLILSFIWKEVRFLRFLRGFRARVVNYFYCNTWWRHLQQCVGLVTS